MKPLLGRDLGEVVVVRRGEPGQILERPDKSFFLLTISLTGCSTATSTETVSNLSLIFVAPLLLILKMEILRILGE